MDVDKDYNFFTENLENTLSTSCCILSLGVINTRFAYPQQDTNFINMVWITCKVNNFSAVLGSRRLKRW